jgi:hypothetical protein
MPFSQKNPVAGQHLCLGHTIHKIEIPYIHKQVLYVVVPVSMKYYSNHIPIFQKTGAQDSKSIKKQKWLNWS